MTEPADYAALSGLAREQDRVRQLTLATIDRLESEARLALARLDGDSRHVRAYAAIIENCAARRAQLLGSLASPQ